MSAEIWLVSRGRRIFGSLLIAFFVAANPLPSLGAETIEVVAPETGTEGIKTAILFGSAETQSAVQRANQIIRRQYQLLDREVAEKERALREAAAATSKARELTREISQLRSQQNALMAEIAQQDFEYQASIRAFREGLTGLFESRDPKVTDALRRYSQGDFSALDDLQALVRIIRQAREAGLQARNGEDQRAVARLWSDARDKGNRTTKQALGAWQEAASIDRNNFEAWIQITHLEIELKDSAARRLAAQRAFDLAKTLPERGAALDELGDIAYEDGRVDDATKLYQQAVDAAEEYVRQAPGNWIRLADLSVGYLRLGTVAELAGNYAGARSAYLKALDLRRRNQAALPDRQGPYWQLGSILDQLSMVELRDNRLKEARVYSDEALGIFKNLLRMNSPSHNAMLDAAIAFLISGDIAFPDGRLNDAGEAYDNARRLYEALYESDRGNTMYRNGLRASISYILLLADRARDFNHVDEATSNFVDLARYEADAEPSDYHKIMLAQALSKRVLYSLFQHRIVEEERYTDEIRGILRAVRPDAQSDLIQHQYGEVEADMLLIEKTRRKIRSGEPTSPQSNRARLRPQ